MRWLWIHLLQETGTLSSSSKAYNFWSGFGSDLGEATILGAVVATYRRHKCQSCLRPALKRGLGAVEGTHYETCHKHTNADHHGHLKVAHQALHPEMHNHLSKEK